MLLPGGVAATAAVALWYHSPGLYYFAYTEHMTGRLHAAADGAEMHPPDHICVIQLLEE
jgi:hypothetical protein